MRRLIFSRRTLGLLCILAGFASIAPAQSAPSAEWTTDSFNPLRDGWQRNETKISTTNAHDLRLLWKIKTDNKTMGKQSFREPLVITNVQTASGSKTLAIVAGSSNDVYAIDADSGTL